MNALKSPLFDVARLAPATIAVAAIIVFVRKPYSQKSAIHHGLREQSSDRVAPKESSLRICPKYTLGSIYDQRYFRLKSTLGPLQRLKNQQPQNLE